MTTDLIVYGKIACVCQSLITTGSSVSHDDMFGLPTGCKGKLTVIVISFPIRAANGLNHGVTFHGTGTLCYPESINCTSFISPTCPTLTWVHAYHLHKIIYTHTHRIRHHHRKGTHTCFSYHRATA